MKQGNLQCHLTYYYVLTVTLSALINSNQLDTKGRCLRVWNVGHNGRGRTDEAMACACQGDIFGWNTKADACVLCVQSDLSFWTLGLTHTLPSWHHALPNVSLRMHQDYVQLWREETGQGDRGREGYGHCHGCDTQWDMIWSSEVKWNKCEPNHTCGVHREAWNKKFQYYFSNGIALCSGVGYKSIIFKLPNMGQNSHIGYNNLKKMFIRIYCIYRKKCVQLLIKFIIQLNKVHRIQLCRVLTKSKLFNTFFSPP